ncbi:MAG: hypothetical protein ACKV2V_09755, partial [Blastocatellia bacterium]
MPNSQEELHALIAQLTEHLRYYREMGVTHVAEPALPAPVTLAPAPVGVTSISASQTPQPIAPMPRQPEKTS